jgi:predicted MFS family arabinose efflux permease
VLGHRAEDLEGGQIDLSHNENASISIIHFSTWSRQRRFEPVTSDDRPSRLPAAPTIAAAGATALMVAMGIGRFAFTPILPMMQQDAGLSVAQGGWLASANYVGYLLGALTAVALGVPVTSAIRAGLAVIGVATLAMGFTHSLAAWILLRAAAGVGSAWVLVFVSAWALGRFAAAGRPRLSGAVFSGVGGGITVAGALCVALMHRSAGSARAWQGLGLLALGATAAIWPILRAEEGAAPAAPADASAARGWDRDALRLVRCYGMFGFGYIIPATFVPAMARQIVADPLVFGSSWPAFGMAAAVSTLVAAAGSRWLGNRRLWACSQLMMALGVAAPVAWPTIGGIMIAALLVGGTFMVNTMVGMQEARAVAGPRATGLMAAMTAAFAAGQVAGPLVAALTVGPRGDFSGSLALASVLLVASGVALLRPPTSAR